jgi:hypothetical protein
MIPDVSDAACDNPSANGVPHAASAIDVAWRNLAHVLITEAHLLAVAALDETAARARLRVGGATADADASHQPSSASALLLGAAIGIVGVVVLAPRIAHD